MRVCERERVNAHLDVRDGRRQLAAPVHQPVAAVDQPFLVQPNEGRAHRPAPNRIFYYYDAAQVLSDTPSPLHTQQDDVTTC